MQDYKGLSNNNRPVGPCEAVCLEAVLKKLSTGEKGKDKDIWEARPSTLHLPFPPTDRRDEGSCTVQVVWKKTA